MRGFGKWLWSQLSSIRVRLTVWYVALLAVILAIFSAFLYVSLANSLYSNVSTLLESDARDAVNMYNQTGRIEIGNLLPGPDLVVIYTPKSKFLSVSGSLSNDSLAMFEQATSVHGRAVEVELPDESQWLVYTVPVYSASSGRVVALLQVGRSLRDTHETLHRLLLLIGIAIPLTLILAVLGGMFLASRALNPIDRITRTAARINAEDLSRRLRLHHGADEVGRLAATFDEMIDRLDRAFHRQRQFTSDASHELRTPLALIRSQAEVTLARERTNEEYRETLENIRDEASRMSALVGDMLTLARADSGAAQLSTEPVRLGELVADVVLQLRPLAQRERVELVWHGNESVPVIHGDETRLTQLALNLIDNAIKYAPGGRVDVSVLPDTSRLRLVVADNGEGIAPEHLSHLFERFYSVDTARTHGDSTGLGLAICEWIVKAHQGTIGVESEPGKGSTFTVTLPVEGSEDETKFISA